MTPEEAQAVLIDKLYAPAFVEKCAELGVRFGDEQELLTALNSTAQLKLLKTASDKESGSLVQAAGRSLSVAQFGEEAVKTAEQQQAQLQIQSQASEQGVDAEVSEAIQALVG